MLHITILMVSSVHLLYSLNSYFLLYNSRYFKLFYYRMILYVLLVFHYFLIITNSQIVISKCIIGKYQLTYLGSITRYK